MEQKFPLDLKTLQKVLDYLNEGVYITDLKRRIMLWNKKAEQITGYSQEEVVGRPCSASILSHVDSAGRNMCVTQYCPLYRTMVTQKAGRTPGVLYAMTADRGRIPLSISVAPLHDEKGNVIGGIEIFRDESEFIRDLEFARKIQQSLLPSETPNAEACLISVFYLSHDMVGGDFYEFFDIGPDEKGILIADVRGHGISASLYTTVLKTICRNFLESASRPADFLTKANHFLSDIIMDEVFATAVFLVLDGKLSQIRYAVAGNPPPLKISPQGIAEPLQKGGMPLGFLKNEKYKEFQSAVEKDEVILLYTDGASEVPGEDGGFLGDDGLAKMAAAVDWNKGEQALKDLYDSLLEYCTDIHLPDDILLIACRKQK